MGIGVWFPIFDSDGKPTVLECGSWFCIKCHKLRKTINYPFTGIIETRCPKCGYEIVYKQE